MATIKTTRTSRAKGGTPAYRALARQLITGAMRKAVNDYFHAIAAKNPRGNSCTALAAFEAEMRAELTWMERPQ